MVLEPESFLILFKTSITKVFFMNLRTVLELTKQFLNCGSGTRVILDIAQRLSITKVFFMNLRTVLELTKQLLDCGSGTRVILEIYYSKTSITKVLLMNLRTVL